MGHYSDMFHAEREAEDRRAAEKWTKAVANLERAIKRFYQEGNLDSSGSFKSSHKKRIVRERLDEALLWAKDRRCYDTEVLSVLEQLAEIGE